MSRVAVTAVAVVAMSGCVADADEPQAIADLADLTPADAASVPDEASDLADDVVALGEYCDRLGHDDVTRIVGLDSSERRWVDGQCAYDLRGAQGEGRLYVSMVDSDGGVGSLRSLRASVDDEVVVEGVGDDAVFRAATVSLHVRDGERAFFVQLVVDPPPAPEVAQEQLGQLVRIMLERR